jgi:uncharacterized coiled-coil DUF342 family protein
MPRDVTNDDLAIIDKAIANHEAVQHDLYVLRRVVGEIGKLSLSDIKRGVEGERKRLDEVSQKANAAQADLDELNKQIQAKQRELRGVEKIIEERRVACDQLNESYNNLRTILAAA